MRRVIRTRLVWTAALMLCAGLTACNEELGSPETAGATLTTPIGGAPEPANGQPGGPTQPNPGAESPPPESTGSGLVVDSFAMIEFQYESLPGFYFYAPQIHVRSALGTVRVKRLQITFPGGAVAPPFCSEGMAVTTAGRDLVGEIYGDYEFTVDLNGHRASAGKFFARIGYVEGNNQSRELLVSGTATSGGLPTTYTAGANSMSPGTVIGCQ